MPSIFGIVNELDPAVSTSCFLLVCLFLVLVDGGAMSTKVHPLPLTPPQHGSSSETSPDGTSASCSTRS